MNKNCLNYCRSAESLTLVFYTLFLDFSGLGTPVLAIPAHQRTSRQKNKITQRQSPSQQWIIFQGLICKSVRLEMPFSFIKVKVLYSFIKDGLSFCRIISSCPLLKLTLFPLYQNMLLVIYRYIINYPQRQQLKRTTIYYLTVFLGGLVRRESGCGLAGWP